MLLQPLLTHTAVAWALVLVYGDADRGGANPVYLTIALASTVLAVLYVAQGSRPKPNLLNISIFITLCFAIALETMHWFSSYVPGRFGFGLPIYWPSTGVAVASLFSLLAELRRGARVEIEGPVQAIEHIQIAGYAVLAGFLACRAPHFAAAVVRPSLYVYHSGGFGVVIGLFSFFLIILVIMFSFEFLMKKLPFFGLLVFPILALSALSGAVVMRHPPLHDTIVEVAITLAGAATISVWFFRSPRWRQWVRGLIHPSAEN